MQKDIVLTDSNCGDVIAIESNQDVPDAVDATTESQRDFVAAAASTDGSYCAGALYGHATCMTEYAETDYSNEIIITAGGKKDSKQWKPIPMPAGAFIAKLCQHKEGTKDGPSFVLGSMVPGQRLKNSVKALYGVGLDIDTGTPSATVDAALLKLGCMAVRYPAAHLTG